jgi:hypothetical protein
LKNTIHELQEVVSEIVCDRCQKSVESLAPSFDLYTTIRHICGYGSVWKDGQIIELDLCEKCLKVLIGDVCRIIDPAEL